MNLEFINKSQTLVPVKYLTCCMEFIEMQLTQKKIATFLGKKDLYFVFLGIHSMRKLNKNYRGKDKTTDVLSFPSHQEDQLGELIFCPSVIKRQARQNQNTYREELAYLAIHGLLHLLGFEHGKKQKAKLMYDLQDSLFFDFIAQQISS